MSKPHPQSHFWKLALGALGVVYGDIGTSPLYALKESFHPAHGLPLTHDNIFGILSLVFWALTLVVTIKYLLFIMRADQQGEGGITTLLALLLQRFEKGDYPRVKRLVIVLGIFGAGLLYGEGVITPGISVLSAIEGLEVATPAFKPIILPLTVVILLVLFGFQKRGAGSIGAVFGPVMVLWFATLVGIGLPWILQRPDILLALNPYHAVSFFVRNGKLGFLVLGSVVLCITGAEALYADMGHFGRNPIRRGWLVVVFPALMINYLGQGAAVLQKGESAIANTFYALVDGIWIYPLVVIATIATVIASQALISGAFSLTLQAMRLGFLPRTAVRYTSRQQEGQIYVQKVNLFMAIACIALVLIFQSSSNLAAAYGIAVTGTMVISSVLFFLISRSVWRWSWFASVSLLCVLFFVDISFFSANLVKILHGGWIPIVIALGFLSIMLTWKRGRSVLAEKMKAHAISLEEFFRSLDAEPPLRVAGTAVFMTLTRDIAPSVLLHHYKHNQTLHEQVLLLSVMTEHEPEVREAERVRTTDLQHGFVKVIARYGYMESPNVDEILSVCEASGTKINREKLSYFLGRETFVTTGDSGMARWRKALFVIMSRNARSAAEYFHLPPDRVIEIGTQIQI